MVQLLNVEWRQLTNQNLIFKFNFYLFPQIVWYISDFPGLSVVSCEHLVLWVDFFGCCRTMITLPIALTEWVCQNKILWRGVGNLTRFPYLDVSWFGGKFLRIELEQPHFVALTRCFQGWRTLTGRVLDTGFLLNLGGDVSVIESDSEFTAASSSKTLERFSWDTAKSLRRKTRLLCSSQPADAREEAREFRPDDRALRPRHHHHHLHCSDGLHCSVRANQIWWWRCQM